MKIKMEDQEIKNCEICGSSDDVDYGYEEYNKICNNCSCELLSIENNPENPNTKEWFEIRKSITIFMEIRKIFDIMP